MKKLVLYHGSPQIIEKPVYGFGKTWNDYGQGFYCTQEVEIAKEWAVSEFSNGYANKYILNSDRLKILDLSGYTMLHWLAILVANRQFEASTPILKRSKDWLLEHFLISTKEYDLIKGYRADDSYFMFARSFLTNQISYLQLSNAMKLGNLGEQIMLKSKKAFECINFESYIEVDFHLYYPLKKKRDEDARNRFKKILESDDIDGLFMRDIIKEKVTEYDKRIQ